MTMIDVQFPLEYQPYVDAMMAYVEATIRTVVERDKKWGGSWDKSSPEGMEALVSQKANRLVNCPPGEKRECLIDLFAYAAKRWQKGFTEESTEMMVNYTMDEELRQTLHDMVDKIEDGAWVTLTRQGKGS